MTFFLQGLTLGLAYIAPIGMQNLFVINAALTFPRRRALAAALIVLFFDITLSISCFYGIGSLMARYEWLQLVILCLGSLLVMSIGIRLFRTRDEGNMTKAAPPTLPQTISRACVVTWFNPQAILDGTMLLGAFHVTLTASQAAPFMTGVITASCAWFLGLVFFISLYSRRFSASILRMINMACGAIIFLYGGKLFCQFLQLSQLWP